MRLSSVAHESRPLVWQMLPATAELFVGLARYRHAYVLPPTPGEERPRCFRRSAGKGP